MNLFRKLAMKIGELVDLRNTEPETIFGISTILAGITLINAYTRNGTIGTLNDLNARIIFAWAFILAGIIIALSTRIPLLRLYTLEIFIIFSFPFALFICISVASAMFGLNNTTVSPAVFIYFGFYYQTARSMFRKYDRQKEIK